MQDLKFGGLEAFESLGVTKPSTTHVSNCGGKLVPKQVNIWAPILKGDSEPTMSLAVRCGEKAPNWEQYRERLQEHLDSKVLSNPKRSRQEIEAMGKHPGSISHSGRMPTPTLGSTDITTRRDGDVAHSDRLAEGQSTPKRVRREPAGEVHRVCVAEVSDRRGEPSSGGGGIAVEQFEGGLRNFGEAQHLFGLSVVEGSGFSAAGKGSLGDDEIFSEVLLREPGDTEELPYGVLTQTRLSGLHKRCSLHVLQAERFADACCRHVGR